MECAIHDHHFDIDHLVARIDSTAAGFLDSIDNGRNVLSWNRATDNLIENFDALAFFIRFYLDNRVAVLAAAPGLADKFAFAIRAARDGFAIGNLRRAGVGFDFKFALQAIDDDFQMQLTHSGDNELARLFVCETAECGILFS